MKKMVSLFIALVLLVGVAMPAFAAGEPSRHGRAPFTLAGTITAIQGTTVTVHVVAGNYVVRPYIGQDLALQTTTATRFLLKTATGTVVITLADLAVGQNVSAQGTFVAGAWTAERITVGAQIIHPR